MFKSVEELQAKISMTLRELDAARELEQAAQLRHAKENRPETEAACARRQEEAERTYQRYRRLLVEFGRRVDARSGAWQPGAAGHHTAPTGNAEERAAVKPGPSLRD